MTERPILFNGPMVLAILDGRKTMTRRVVDMPRGFAPRNRGNGIEFGRITSQHPKRGKFGLFIEENRPFGPVVDLVPCKYGQPGDRLWVKETFTLSSCGTPVYRADAKDKTGMRWNSIEIGDPQKEVKWKPSIFMHRYESRITLEIAALRVERLQDITESDARAEGVSFGQITNQETGEIDCDAADAFELLWDSINGDRKDKHGHRLPYSWDDNPWVWVIEFKRAETNKGKV